MAKLYDVEPSYLPVLEERLHSMAFRLRPGESLQRYFHARGYWHLSPSYVRGFQKHATVKDGIGPGEAGPEGPTERFWPNRRYGNGFWYYKPDLTSKTRDIELGSDRFEGFAQDEKGLFLNRDNAVIECSFASPYLYCGIPDPHGRLPALNGAILNMSFNCGPNTELKVSIVDAAGKETMIVERTDEIDAEIDIDYTEWIDGSCHFKLIIAVKGDYFSLNHFANTLWCMVSPHALPALSQKGENKMAVHFGDCRSFKSRPLYENIRIDRHPEEIAQIVTCENVDYVPDTHSIIRSADKKNPWTLVFKIDTPKPLLWSSVYTLIEGYKPNEKIANRNFDFSCSDSPDGPWTEFKSGEILEHDQGWPAGFYGEAEFSGNSTTGYIRIRAFTGIPYLRFTHHFDDQPEYDSTLDVTHGWYGDDPEVGRRLRTHSQTIDSNTDAYTISCDETPHNAFIRLDCPSSNTDRNKKN
ncbi:MAG: hypothetical protein HRT89_00570 [Lentisphaeria bacterium]|nr:hypothetical protein [Lentisphaeria bacterium]